MNTTINSDIQLADRRSTILFLSVILLIILTVLTSSNDMWPGVFGDFIAFSSYLLFLGMFIRVNQIFELPKIPLLAFGGIYTTFIVGFARDVGGYIDHPSTYIYPITDTQLLLHTGEILGYIVASFTLVFLIPKAIQRDWFFISVVSISTLSFLIGLPAYVIGDYALLGVSVNTYTSLEPFRQYGIHIPALASIWDDANAMSKIAVAGLIGSHYLYSKRQSTILRLLIGVNAFALFLANSKMSIIAVIIAYFVFFIYRRFEVSLTVTYLGIMGLIGFAMFLLIVFGIGSNTIVPIIGFSDRVYLWKASIFTFFEHPIIGIGIHNVGKTISTYTAASQIAPQNSYLSIFVAGGTIGGGLYLWIVASSAFKYIERIESKADLLTLCLFIAFILIQFTDTSHPFGINKNALIFGITLGYIIKRVYNPSN